MSDTSWLYVMAGGCPASIVLKRACHLRSSLYPTQPPSLTAGS
jgi:hypothetical protein